MTATPMSLSQTTVATPWLYLELLNPCVQLPELRVGESGCAEGVLCEIHLAMRARREPEVGGVHRQYMITALCAWQWHYISRARVVLHPDVQIDQANLHRELDARGGRPEYRSNMVAGVPAVPSLPYLQALLNEALRINASAGPYRTPTSTATSSRPAPTTVW
uniref:Uncharacterized protein n=1 Tax=Oryza meridionalis TaxID=40149 RepID=A0A0E0D745_9ORYZ